MIRTNVPIGGRPGALGWDLIARECREVLPADLAGCEPGGVNAAYWATLYALAAAADPTVIVEIGTQHGVSTRAFLAVAARTEGVVHSIDADPTCGEGRLLSDVTQRGWAANWRFHAGKSDAVEPIPCDLLYVDGDHEYESVCRDMRRFGPLVREGGLVILDDYHWSWPGKMRWVDEREAALVPLMIGAFAVVRVTPRAKAAFALDCSSRPWPTADWRTVR